MVYFLMNLYNSEVISFPIFPTLLSQCRALTTIGSFRPFCTLSKLTKKNISPLIAKIKQRERYRSFILS